MDDLLERNWRHQVAAHPFRPMPALLDEGLVLGAGTVLARTLAKAGGGGSVDLEGDHDRVIALLAVVHNGRLPPDLTSHLEAAVAAWARGDKALANIRLGFARLPILTCEHDGFRLFLGERALAGGVAPAGLMRELSLAEAAFRLLKYPGQPRVPAGSGRASGQFGSGQGGAPAATPVFVEPLIGDLAGPLGVVRPLPPTLPLLPDPAPAVAPKPGDHAPPGAPPAPSDDDPRRCPAPVKDTPHGAQAPAKQYEVDGHNEVNKVDPLKQGEAIFYHGIYFDDCARTDDMQDRWKAGDLIEFKGPRLDYLFKRFFNTQDKLDREAFLRDLAVEGTGRRVKYLFAERGAADSATRLLEIVKTSMYSIFSPSLPFLEGVRARDRGTRGAKHGIHHKGDASLQDRTSRRGLEPLLGASGWVEGHRS